MRTMEHESLARALSAAAHWLTALADAGPDLRVNAHRKAAHEAAELAADPSLEEFADVVICLVGTALQHRWSVGDVAGAVARKVAVNSRRRWVQQEDGTWQHDAEEALT